MRNIHLTTVGIVCVLGVASCTSPDRFDGNQSHEKANKGALIGGIVGAVGGIITGDNAKERRQNAIKGAVIGGATGAIIGNQLDKQEADLRRDMSGSGAVIQNTGDRLIVTLPQDILFATDSTQVRSDLVRDLQSLAGNLQAYPDSRVQIIGHTDNVGEASYNYDLSVRRAAAVGDVLIREGISSGRIQTLGRGEDQPVASNLTPEGRRQNRRVEVVIVPNN